MWRGEVGQVECNARKAVVPTRSRTWTQSWLDGLAVGPFHQEADGSPPGLGTLLRLLAFRPIRGISRVADHSTDGESRHLKCGVEVRGRAARRLQNIHR